MSDRPILFSAPMVRALLAGTKTQTRRVIKPQPPAHTTFAGFFSTGLFGWMAGDPADLESWEFLGDFKTPIMVGDRLWVRETHAIVPRTAYRMSEGVQQTLRPNDDHDAAVYAEGWERSRPGRWRPSIHMPRWASRRTLTVTDVRVERLQDINEADAIAEGCFKGKASGRVFANAASMHFGGDEWSNARDWFADLWENINGDGSWAANPWIVAYTFTVALGNIDQIGGA